MTSRLNEAVKLLLKDIVRFQDRQHERNPVKAFAKRRYISGFREVRKKLNVKKVKLIIIAPDLELAKNKGELIIVIMLILNSVLVQCFESQTQLLRSHSYVRKNRVD